MQACRCATTESDRCSHGSSRAGPVTDWTSAAESDTEAFGRFFRAMLESGIYLPPSQFEAAFLGAAHTEQDVQQDDCSGEAGVCSGARVEKV